MIQKLSFLLCRCHNKVERFSPSSHTTFQSSMTLPKLSAHKSIKSPNRRMRAQDKSGMWRVKGAIILAPPRMLFGESRHMCQGIGLRTLRSSTLHALHEGANHSSRGTVYDKLINQQTAQNTPADQNCMIATSESCVIGIKHPLKQYGAGGSSVPRTWRHG